MPRRVFKLTKVHEASHEPEESVKKKRTAVSGTERKR